MPSPSSTSFLRPDLGQSFQQFDLDMAREGFIGLRVAPTIDVALQTSNFSRIPVAELIKAQKTDRAPGSGYMRGTYHFEQDNYACEEHGWEEPVDDRERNIYAYSFDAELLAAQRARDVVMRNFEKRMADLIFNTTTWTGAALTTDVSNEWDDAANATPIADVTAAKILIRDSSGLMANALILDWEVFENLKNCDEIIDRVKYWGGQDPNNMAIGAAEIARALGLKFIIVAGASTIKNTADEGQTASFSQIWDDEYAMVCRVAETNDLREPCIARTFHFANDGSSIGGTVEQYRDETVRSDIIRVRMDTDEKVLYAAAGHLLGNITS